MRIAIILAVAICIPQTPAFSQQPPPVKVGDVIYETDFEGADALKDWPGSATLEQGCESAQALALERPAGSDSGSTVAQHVLPVEQVRGCLIHLSGMVKARDVSDKPASWNGIKFMSPVTTPGGKMHPQARIGVGSFDWQRFIFPVRVPDDATDIRLYMGLEAVTGKVWFDDIKIVVRKLPFVPRPPATEGPVYKGHDLPRLRGAMISPNIDEDSLRLFGRDWNANLARWQLVGWRPEGPTLDLDAYDAWLAEQLAKLDAALPLCEKYGVYVVVDLHSKPGGSAESGQSLFSSKACQDKFIENWRMMARKYRDSEVVWAYDLVNEPIEDAVAEGVMDWEELATATARAIREIDADHAIIVEPPHGGNPYGLSRFNPIDVPNIVYSVHMYLPHVFTHQGVHSEWKQKWHYPGEIQGKQWDQAQLERALQPAIDFQRRYNVHMYLGEFSAIRWAPDGSAYRYLRDLIDIFEAHDWDWTYHAFREWTGWSVEHGPDPENTKPVAEPTPRQKLLTEWFSKNQKPSW